MIINMVGGGGGAALNFKVVPGLTQPGTASKNTIWVKSEKIGSWYFSATQPEGLQEWDVWFPTGTESDMEFNALRKNALQVYPLSAKQMVEGTLVDVETKINQNGEWVDWFASGDIVKNGKLNPNVNLNGELRIGQSFNVEQEDGHVRVNSKSSTSGGVATDTPYNVDDFSKITLKCNVIKMVQGSSGIAGCRVGLVSELNTSDAYAATTGNFVASIATESNGEQQLECDISSVSGNYYPAISFNVTSSVYPDIIIYDFNLS